MKSSPKPWTIGANWSWLTIILPLMCVFWFAESNNWRLSMTVAVVAGLFGALAEYVVAAKSGELTEKVHTFDRQFYVALGIGMPLLTIICLVCINYLFGHETNWLLIDSYAACMFCKSIPRAFWPRKLIGT